MEKVFSLPGGTRKASNYDEEAGLLGRDGFSFPLGVKRTSTHRHLREVT
jgi:hypothetical protein